MTLWFLPSPIVDGSMKLYTELVTFFFFFLLLSASSDVNFKVLF